MKKLISTKEHINKKHIILTFKVSAAEMQEILKRSGAWTGKNVSEYIRYSALNFKPTKGDFRK